MSTIQHKAVTGADLHGIVAFSVASTAGRNALSVGPGDVGKVCRVTADNSFYILTSVSPVVWSSFGQVPTLATVATSGSYTDLTSKPDIPAAYTLPVASTSALGGIKVGTGLSIDGTGVVTAPPGASLTTASTWLAAQRGAIVALTVGTDIALDFTTSNNFSLMLTQSFTLSNPINVVAGQSGVIAVTQDGVGNRTISWGSHFKAAGGTKPLLTTTAGAVDYISYYVESVTRIFVSIAADVK